jgi:hypothetical protein
VVLGNRVLKVLLAVLVLAASAWWLLGGQTTVADGELMVTWSGAHSGSAQLPGTVGWCPVDRTGTLEAISADTGLMISLFEADSLFPAIHPVLAPAMREEVPRPGAVAGLRWVQGLEAIRGFQSVSGLIDLREVGTTVSGGFDIRMQSVTGTDTLVVRGTFQRLPVTASAVGCS